tara:strand:- start:2004 stop:2381 length:378 start_codon:yes stop_codon:yes gene_type:complete
MDSVCESHLDFLPYDMIMLPNSLNSGLPFVAGMVSAQEPVVVSSKIDTEGGVLGQMILQRLETGGIPVKIRLQLGSTSIVRSAIKAGEVDLYPEYTGNAVFFMGATRHRQPDLQQRRFLRAVKFC